MSGNPAVFVSSVRLNCYIVAHIEPESFDETGAMQYTETGKY